MPPLNKTEILNKAKDWFRDCIASKHIINTTKLENPNEFNINPFLAAYLASFLSGDTSPVSIAKALVYPRVLGTSITTSFGQNMQAFTQNVLGSFGSTTLGIDIEFIDQLDQHKKYCQIKSGPNTINKDDVESIAGHFKSIRNLARTNNLRLGQDDLIVGVLYGSPEQLSSHYKRLSTQYNHPVFVGEEFWHRLTGDNGFYYDLIDAIASIANEANFSSELNRVIENLATNEQIIEITMPKV